LKVEKNLTKIKLYKISCDNQIGKELQLNG